MDERDIGDYRERGPYTEGFKMHSPRLNSCHDDYDPSVSIQFFRLVL